MQYLRPMFWFLICFSTTFAKAQCHFSVETIDNLTICSSESATLEAFIIGTPLFFEWSPTIGLINPLSLHPTINDPVDTTYTIKVMGFNEMDNLIVNSDFSEGNIGFTSKYEGESKKPGGFIIGKLGTDLFPEAKLCEDHSNPGGGGNMLLAKVSDSENVEIYCQEVIVKPNQAYHFSAFVAGLWENNPPVIVLKINGETIVAGTIGSFACSWQQVQGDWNSGSTTTAKVCILVSEEDIGAKTDFALDDVGFYEVCEAEKSVKVKVVPFEISIKSELVTLPCGDSTNLEVAVSPIGLYFLTEWTSIDGNIISGEQSSQLLVDDAGMYEVEILASIGNQVCRDKKTIQVELVSRDSLDIYTTNDFDCIQQEAIMEAFDQVNRLDFLYQWTTIEGNIIGDTNTPTVMVNQSGIYELQRTDLLGNCPISTSMEIFDNRIKDFSIDLMPPNCEYSKGMILFNEIIGGLAPYSYSIDNGVTFQSERIFANLEGGDYLLIVQDANECQWIKDTSFTSFIPLELTLPNSIILEKGKTYQIPLTFNLPDSLIEDIEWVPSIGLSCSDCTTPFFKNNNSQTYQVTVSDKNGCEQKKAIRINLVTPSDIYIPTAFSPNDDGENDIFTMFGNTKVVKKIQQFLIFDRYGNLVFDQSNIEPNVSSSGWNGRFKGQKVQEGVYVYQIAVEFKDGKIKNFRGEVSIVSSRD